MALNKAAMWNSLELMALNKASMGNINFKNNSVTFLELAWSEMNCCLDRDELNCLVRVEMSSAGLAWLGQLR